MIVFRIIVIILHDYLNLSFVHFHELLIVIINVIIIIAKEIF